MTPFNTRNAPARRAARFGPTLLACVGCAALAAHASADVTREWQQGLFLDGFPATIRTSAVFDDDGPGPHQPALYLGGNINTLPDGTEAWGIVKWDGQTWSALPPLWYGQNRGVVYSLAVYDPDGAGPLSPVLVVGGVFNSQSGTATPDLTVQTLTTWNGVSWKPLGGIKQHFSENVLSTELVGAIGATAMCVFDDGSGPALFVGGNFRGAGSVICNGVAKWDGSTWTELGSGVLGVSAENSFPRTMAVHDPDGPGPTAPRLYIGGNFLGGKPLIAQWNGSTLTAVGPSLYASQTAGSINDLVSFDGALYAATSPFNDNDAVLRWDGSAWTQPTGIDDVPLSLQVYDDGSGPALFAGLDWSHHDAPADTVQKWDGSTLTPIGADLYNVMKNGSHVVVFDAGPNPGLYSLEGRFCQRWDGADWQPVNENGEGTLGSIPVVLHADLDGPGGSPAKLYGAGFGNHGTATPADWDGASLVGWVGEYNGSHWSIMGDAFTYVGSDSYAGQYGYGDLTKLILVPSGPAQGLYVGGRFTFAGPVNTTQVDSIARWNGATWDAVGAAGVRADVPFDSPPGATTEDSGTIFDAVVYDPDGAGPLTPRLVVAGFFKSAGGVSANNIAQWDGTAWSTLGSGFDARVTKLAVADFGSGPRLIASGDFSTAGGVAAPSIASWNGAAWSALGSGIPAPPPPYSYFDTVLITAMEPFDDGNGEQLVVAGNFLQAGGVNARHVARWNGTSWSSMHAGLPLFSGSPPFFPSSGMWPSIGTFNDLIVWDDGTGPALYGINYNTTVYGNDATIDAQGNGYPHYLGKWTGTSWQELQYGEFEARFGSVGRLYAATKDGDGPDSSLYISGSFREVDGVRSDGIARWAPPVSTCVADVDANGVLNLDDINLFAAAFLAGDLAADVDANGVLNLDDINLFAAAFLAGCP